MDHPPAFVVLTWPTPGPVAVIGTMPAGVVVDAPGTVDSGVAGPTPVCVVVGPGFEPADRPPPPLATADVAPDAAAAPATVAPPPDLRVPPTAPPTTAPITTNITTIMIIIPFVVRQKAVFVACPFSSFEGEIESRSGSGWGVGGARSD
jgi:hypothetical protein